MKIYHHFQFALMVLAVMVSGPAAQGAALGIPIGETSAPRQGARFVGRVLASGAHETPRALKVFKNRKFCGATVANETLLIDAGAGLGNAVVTLTPADRSITAAPRRIVLDNQRCAFVPHVQVGTLGSDLLLRNSDPILHTVHARLGKETLFNVGLPTWRQVTKRLDRAGVMRIDCDVLHTWMSAAIMVVTTPHFAITDTHGNFALDGLPPGAYDAEVWHERLGVRKARVNLQESRVVALEVIFSLQAPLR